MAVDDAAVIYPGARVDLFGAAKLGRPLPPAPNGTTGRPLRVCFAGLQMGSKGPHTLARSAATSQAERGSHSRNACRRTFQADYAHQLRQFCANHN